MAIKTNRDKLSIDTVIRHRWKLVSDNDYGEKKYTCALCPCEKITSVSFINHKPFHHTSYVRSGNSTDYAPDCWGAKNPV